MNPFAKAAIASIVIIVIASLSAMQFDNARIESLKKEINYLVADSQAQQVIYKYISVIAKNSSEYCPNLLELRNKQFLKTNSFGMKLQEYEKRNVFNEEYDLLKTQYFTGLVDMYVTGVELKELCGYSEHQLVLLYTVDKSCPNCGAQQKIIEKIQPRCEKLRVYAFPTDGNSAMPHLITSRHPVSTVPALVLDDALLLEGYAGADDILSKLAENGVVCT